ncbi:MAG: ammonium transporter, partial [Acidimicrobiia bacterium]
MRHPELHRRQQRPARWSPAVILALTLLPLAVIACGVLAGGGLASATGDPTGTGTGGPPLRQGEDLVDRVLHNQAGLDLLWMVLGGILVVFMQAGFALLETGFCRAKNAVHVFMTNFTIFGLVLVGYFAVGFALMFQGATVARIGLTEPFRGGWFLGGDSYDVSVAAFFLYQLAFAATAATIPTGAMAERWKFSSFVWWGLFCGTLYYPLYGSWVWGGGWLSQLGTSAGLGHGVVDFAGSGVVHAMGGFIALAGAIVIGPRIG